MVNVSKKFLEKDLKRKAWHILEKKIKESGDIGEVFRKVFTSSEISMIEKRLAILAMLQSGNSYLTIRRTIDVSPGTISFIKHGFKINKREPKTGVIFDSRLIPIRKKKKYPRYKGTRGLGLAEW